MKRILVCVLVLAACSKSDKDSGKSDKKGGKGSASAMNVEAKVMLKRIVDGARSYYMESTHFPPTVSMTPALGACCQQPNHICAPTPDEFGNATWQALKFSVDDPHHYSYEFISAGDGPTAGFTARAMGDLDCDGKYSTFEMQGSVGPDGTITGTQGLFSQYADE
jgi:hypothetical protein